MSVMVYKLQEIYLHQVKITCTFGLLHKASRFDNIVRQCTELGRTRNGAGKEYVFLLTGCYVCFVVEVFKLRNLVRSYLVHQMVQI